jgi:hypothetical protein
VMIGGGAVRFGRLVVMVGSLRVRCLRHGRIPLIKGDGHPPT